MADESAHHISAEGLAALDRLKSRPGAIIREHWLGQWRDDPDDQWWIKAESERAWANQYAGETNAGVPAAHRGLSRRTTGGRLA